MHMFEVVKGGRQVLRLTNKSKWVEETDLLGERLDDFMQDSLTVDCMQGCLRGG